MIRPNEFRASRIASARAEVAESALRTSFESRALASDSSKYFAALAVERGAPDSMIALRHSPPCSVLWFLLEQGSVQGVIAFGESSNSTAWSKAEVQSVHGSSSVDFPVRDAINRRPLPPVVSRQSPAEYAAIDCGILRTTN